MVTLDTRATRREGITLVEATLSHEGADPRRVHLRSTLDGPVYPPRSEGVPAAGWDSDAGTLSVTVAPGQRVPVGFASPAAPVDPPIEVVDTERATPDGGIGDTPAAVVRALGDPSPPADAVALPAGSGGRSAGAEDRSGTETTRSTGSERPPSEEAPDEDHDSPDGPESGEDALDIGAAGGSSGDPEVDRPDAGRTRGQRDARDGDAPDRVGGYPAVAAWLSAVQRRVEAAEEDSHPPDTRLAADADRLRTVARRAVELAERADTVREGGA